MVHLRKYSVIPDPILLLRRRVEKCTFARDGELPSDSLFQVVGASGFPHSVQGYWWVMVIGPLEGEREVVGRANGEVGTAAGGPLGTLLALLLGEKSGLGSFAESTEAKELKEKWC
jgi:hypothetical protein